jgi:DNA-binding NarL/FixJ family response regulator
VTSGLLVDDDADLCLLLLRVTLSARGFDIVGAARDGWKGVAQAAPLQPDVIVLDLATPTMDGLRGLPLLAQVAAASPVVVLSAQADDIQARTPALGGRDFERKPTTMTRLAQVLTGVHADGAVGNPGDRG